MLKDVILHKSENIRQSYKYYPCSKHVIHLKMKLHNSTRIHNLILKAKTTEVPD